VICLVSSGLRSIAPSQKPARFVRIQHLPQTRNRLLARQNTGSRDTGPISYLCRAPHTRAPSWTAGLIAPLDIETGNTPQRRMSTDGTWLLSELTAIITPWRPSRRTIRRPSGLITNYGPDHRRTRCREAGARAVPAQAGKAMPSSGARQPKTSGRPHKPPRRPSATRPPQL
jgi:hypothetical protein